MTQKILGPEGSKRRKRFWLVPLVAGAPRSARSETGSATARQLCTPTSND